MYVLSVMSHMIAGGVAYMLRSYRFLNLQHISKYKCSSKII